MTAPFKSKTIVTWLAIVLGVFGAHRFYLHGARDRWAWLHPWPTFAGIAGAIRMHNLGQDDRVAWLLLPVLGAMVTIAMLAAIVYGLTPDERWNTRFNPADHPPMSTRWGPVLGVIVALMIGATALMATLAFAGQRFFEWQIEDSRQAAARPGSAPAGR